MSLQHPSREVLARILSDYRQDDNVTLGLAIGRIMDAYHTVNPHLTKRAVGGSAPDEPRTARETLEDMNQDESWHELNTLEIFRSSPPDEHDFQKLIDIMKRLALRVREIEHDLSA